MTRLDGNAACGLWRGHAGWRRDECETFVEAHYRGVHRFLFWLTGDRDAAADLTQESFAEFWASLSRRGPDEVPDARAWLYGIARNRWRKRRRDEGRPDRTPAVRLGAGSATTEDAEALAETLADGAPGPEAALMAAADGEAVRGAIAGLPPDYREALVLRVYEELSYRQIAEAVGISEELARWRTHEARRRLRRALLPSWTKEETGASA